MILRNNLQKNLFLVFYLVAVTYFVLRNTKQTYGVNDDLIIQSWLSGAYTGDPEPMIRGSATPKILFGYILSNLYKLFPFVNWFTIIILVFTLFSWFLIGQVAIKLNQIGIFLFFLFISFLHLFWFIPAPTYTACAVLLAFSILLRILNIHLNSNRNLIILSLIYAFAYLIRPESFFFGSLALVPFLVKKFVSNKKFQIKLILFFFVTLIVIAFDYSVENNYYKNDKNWNEYKKLETARYKIQANRIESELMNNPKKYDWTESEAKLFEQYITLDTVIFNESRYNLLINNLKYNSNKFNLNDYFVIGYKNLINSDINWEWFNLGKLIPTSWLFFAFIFWPRIGKFFMLTSLSFLLVFFAMIYVSYFLRQPERVQVSAIFVTILIPFIFSTFYTEEKIEKLDFGIKGIQYIILFLIVMFCVPQIQYLNKKYAGANNVFWLKERDTLSEFPPNSIFVGNASQFRNNWTNPYLMQQSEVEERIFTLGWHNYSPHWKTRASKLGLNPQNMWDSIINNKNVYFVSDKDTFNYILEFLNNQEILFKDVKNVRSIDFVGNDYSVWKFSN